MLCMQGAMRPSRTFCSQYHSSVEGTTDGYNPDHTGEEAFARALWRRLEPAMQRVLHRRAARHTDRW